MTGPSGCWWAGVTYAATVPRQVGVRAEGRQVADLAAAGADGLGGGSVAGVLEADRPRRQGGQEVAQAVDGARGDDDVLGVGVEAPGPREVGGELGAELGQSARVVVAARGSRRGHVAPGPAPGGRVSRVDPRRAGVEPDGGRTLRQDRVVHPRGPARTAGRDERPAAVPALQPALGHELVVGLLRQGAGDAEVGRQRPAARQPVADRGRAGDDDLPDLVGQLGAEGSAAGAVEPQRQREERHSVLSESLESGPCVPATCRPR